MVRMGGVFLLAIGLIALLFVGTGSVDAGKDVITLDEAVDNSTVTWATGGTVPWFGQTTVKHDGVDAAQSGMITHSESSELTTQMDGPGTLFFWWKVSSEADHDYLRFSIDGVLQDRISGNVWFSRKAYNLGPGTHTLKWKYSKDAEGTSGSDTAWLDQVTFAPNVSLGEALDIAALTWSMEGNAEWIGQCNITSDGQDAAQSGPITHNQSSVLSTQILGPGVVFFRWKVSSEAAHDFLRFAIDGVLQDRISGEVFFSQKRYVLGEGVHTLKWKYSKDAVGTAGRDAAWVDRLVYFPGTVTVNLPGDVPLEMMLIPQGSFDMGSPDAERGRNINEGPVHPVTLGYDFYMGKYEVTQAQWLALMGSWEPGYAPSASNGLGGNYPAYWMSWDDARNFVAALNAHIAATGQGTALMRLPSEAEWEYACRADAQTRFFFGDSLDMNDDCEDDGLRTLYMWYCGDNSPNGSKPVGAKLPNAFGLYDMSGNVFEWCEDDWHANYTGAPADGSPWVSSPRTSYRMIRGGYWSSAAWQCRSARRIMIYYPSTRYSYLGFRVATTP